MSKFLNLQINLYHRYNFVFIEINIFVKRFRGCEYHYNIRIRGGFKVLWQMMHHIIDSKWLCSTVDKYITLHSRIRGFDFCPGTCFFFLPLQYIQLEEFPPKNIVVHHYSFISLPPSN